MNEKRITNRDVSYLIRRPENYTEVDKTDGMTRNVKCYHPDIERYCNSDGEPHFLISTPFISDYLDGINCELKFQHNHWILTDNSNCAFAFGSNTVEATSKQSDLKRFKKYVQSLSQNFDIRKDKRQETYYIKFSSLDSLQKAFYNMINFEMAYASVMSFIA